MTSLRNGCLQLPNEFTRDDLLATGLSPAAADELMAFAAKLAAKYAPMPDKPPGAPSPTRDATP